jgi:hypothetical protein
MRILLGLILIALIVAGGMLVYRAGFAQGAAFTGEGDLTFHDYAGNPRGFAYPMRGYFFFPGGFLFGLLFLFLFFGLIRRAFFAPRWGMHRMYSGKWQDKAESWHAEMHNRMEGQPADPDEGAQEQTEEE